MCQNPHHVYYSSSWFQSYLSKSTQVTGMTDCNSVKDYTLYGVPQGSVLGPLLFLLYINDIIKASTKFNFFLFADDTNLLYANKNLKTLEKVVNEELIKISDCLIANKLTLNIKWFFEITHDESYLLFTPLPRTKLFHMQYLYNRWEFDIAWLLYEQKFIKRLDFACRDAMKVARKLRGKKLTMCSWWRLQTHVRSGLTSKLT